MKSPIEPIAKERIFLLKFKNFISKIITVDIRELNFILDSVQKETLNSKKKSLYEIIQKIIKESKKISELMEQCPLTKELEKEIWRWEKLKEIISGLELKDLKGFQGELSSFLRKYQGTILRLKHLIDEEIEEDNEFIARRRALMR